ncbi:hypothetical protein BC830DRAFT_1166438 [Chytriomyces sp. MP71]|nr:hypothetical protein BC830DRAFT_1166438 [Chytriomyces sp. MP71]
MSTPIGQPAYEEQWAQLSHFLECVMDAERHAQVPLHRFSHETLYRSVYQLCLRPSTKQRLRSDFVAAVESLLLRQRSALAAALGISGVGANYANPNDANTGDAPELVNSDAWSTVRLGLFFRRFEAFTAHSVWAASVVRDIFSYFEKAQCRLDTADATANIRALIFSAIKTIVIDPYEPKLFELFALITESTENGFSKDYMSLNVPLYVRLHPNVPRPYNFFDLQVKYNRMQAMQDISKIRAEYIFNGTLVLNPALQQHQMHQSGDSIMDAWALFKNTLRPRKRGGCEDEEEGDIIDSAREGASMDVDGMGTGRATLKNSASVVNVDIELDPDTAHKRQAM